MLGFCIRNWGRTDGGGIVGSNTTIKIIYRACNSPPCEKEEGLPSPECPPGLLYGWEHYFAVSGTLKSFGGFDGFYHFPSLGILLLKQFEEPTAELELLPLAIYLTPMCHTGHIFPPHHPVQATAGFTSPLMA